MKKSSIRRKIRNKTSFEDKKKKNPVYLKNIFNNFRSLHKIKLNSFTLLFALQ